MNCLKCYAVILFDMFHRISCFLFFSLKHLSILFFSYCRHFFFPTISRILFISNIWLFTLLISKVFLSSKVFWSISDLSWLSFTKVDSDLSSFQSVPRHAIMVLLFFLSLIFFCKSLELSLFLFSYFLAKWLCI